VQHCGTAALLMRGAMFRRLCSVAFITIIAQAALVPFFETRSLCAW